MSLHPGGGAVNTATALSALGFNAALVGKIGLDPLGDFLIETLEKRGVNVQAVGRAPDYSTSATMVMVDPDRERRFVHHIGANATLVAEDVASELLDEASILLIAGSFVLPGLDGLPAAGLLKRAREKGTITFLDTAWDASRRWMDLIQPCLPHLDYMFPNLAEARALTGQNDPADMAQALIDCGVGTVAIKLGSKGCLVKNTAGDLLHSPAYEVAVQDTTGAGDAFAAGFIAGVHMNWSLEKTARLANAVGALCVTGMGALGGVTSLEETLNFMSTQVSDEAVIS
jgi:sugar/nucleoside kinase (ribokinase family)